MKRLFLLAFLVLMPAAHANPILQGNWWLRYTDKFENISQCDELERPEHPSGTPNAAKCREAFEIRACMDLESITSAPFRFMKTEYPVENTVSILVTPNIIKKDGLGNWVCRQASIARLWCNAGSCQVFPSGGEYGFAPGELSRASIDGRKWSWTGDHPDWIGYQMWKALKNGSRFAYQLSWWVDDYAVGVETLVIPPGLKEATYRASLKKPGE